MTLAIKSIQLRNFLSFGADSPVFELEPLNVFIGPNGSGKTNLLEAIGVLASTPTDLARALARGGGVSEWLWKGRKDAPVARIEVVLDYPKGPIPLRYALEFGEAGQRLRLVDEVIENERPTMPGEDDVYFFYRYQNGHPVLNVKSLDKSDARFERQLQREELSPEQSVLAQRKDPDQYPELTWIGGFFDSVRLYRNWEFGRQAAMRKPAQTDLPNDFVDEDISNLALVINELDHQPLARQELMTRLRRLYPGLSRLSTRLSGGTVQLFVEEEGLSSPIPATRLSDGTLRFIFLLALLCHPSPPPVVCLEEPEIGLHPDMIVEVARLLIEASSRCQLFVTTHSDMLVSALSQHAKSVVVTEKFGAETVLHRQDPERLKKWLETYTLGDLWKMGEIGGTR